MNLAAATVVMAAGDRGIPSPSQSVWYLGPLPLRAYALAILGGILVASLIAIRRYRARGGPEGAFADALIVAVPLGIIGARIYHVLTSPDAYFGPDGNLLHALYIWRGGLGIIGAVAFGTLGAWLVLRRKGLRLAPMADAIAPALLVAQAIGRLGNYFNQELFGGPTDLPWGLQIDPEILRAHGFPPDTLVHPTFLYELVWNLVMAGLLIALDRRMRLGYGKLFCLYVFAYSLGRFWIEMVRVDHSEIILGQRLNVWSALLLGLGALIAFLILSRLRPGREDSVWLPGREPEEAMAEAGAGQDRDEETGAASEPDPDPTDADAQIDSQASTITADDVEDDRT